MSARIPTLLSVVIATVLTANTKFDTAFGLATTLGGNLYKFADTSLINRLKRVSLQ